VPSFHHSIPSRWITRYSNIIGESFERPIYVSQQGIQIYKESGYKTLRLVTEILPATLAISTRVEPVWGIIAFSMLFLLGLAQLAMMWKPISGAIGNSMSAILLSCITGLFLGFPLTTDNGIFIIHFLDFIFGGSWWLLILWASFIIAIFMVRGRPYTSDILVKELRLTETLSVFLAFSWNVLVPLALILLSIMEYKKTHTHELFHQRGPSSLNHLSTWPLWTKQLGGFLQVSLLILVPCVSLAQIYIYLTKGPRDILEVRLIRLIEREIKVSARLFLLFTSLCFSESSCSSGRLWSRPTRQYRIFQSADFVIRLQSRRQLPFRSRRRPELKSTTMLHRNTRRHLRTAALSVCELQRR
jgi:solute carrier family 6 (neurotransmitter transporter), invertebrate